MTLIKQLFGLFFVFFSLILALLALFGFIGVAINSGPGRIISTIIFALIAGAAFLCLRFGVKLIRTKPPEPKLPTLAPLALAPNAQTRTGDTPTAAERAAEIQEKIRAIVHPNASVDQLREALLTLNAQDLPFRIADGTPDGCDLVAEWKLVDAEWYQFFAKAGLRKVFRIFMKFDTPNRTVRSIDKEYSVSWTKGIPKLSVSASAFRGQKWGMKYSAAIALRKEDMRPGVVYSYKFNTSEIKSPIKDIIKACGWRHKGVAFAKL